MEEFYERYWSSEKEDLPDFNLKWPKLRKFIPLKPQITIVDFGCGNGRLIREIKALNPSARLIGLDVSENALKKARRFLPEVEFFKIGEKIPLNDNSVNFIFCSEVIEHIYDTEKLFSEWQRILKPGGQLLLTTPYHGFIKNLLITLFAFDKHFSPTGSHIRFFSKKILFSLLNQHNLKIKKYGYYGRFFPVPHLIFVLAEKI